jgi:hypothetical protein
MKTLAFTLLTFATLVFPRQIRAGTLDDAPFRIVVPNNEWQIEDSKAQPMGNGIVLLATLSNTNAGLKSAILKTAFKTKSASSLDELCEGMREVLANPDLKKPSDEATTLLGHKARRFTFQTVYEGEVIYREATVFVMDGKGWAILSIGRLEDKEETKKIINFVQKKESLKKPSR